MKLRASEREPVSSFPSAMNGHAWYTEPAVAFAALFVLLLSGCASGHIAAGTAGPVVSSCDSPDLSLAVMPLTEGAGNNFFRYSLMNASTDTCDLPAGTPTLTFVSPGGQSLVTDTVLSLGGILVRSPSVPSPGPIQLTPGAKVWFLVDARPVTCPAPALTDSAVLGIPTESISLPGSGLTIRQIATAEEAAAICAGATVDVSELQTAEPALSGDSPYLGSVVTPSPS